MKSLILSLFISTSLISVVKAEIPYCAQPVTQKMEDNLNSNFEVDQTWMFMAADNATTYIRYISFVEKDYEEDKTKFLILLATEVDIKTHKPLDQCVVSFGFTSEELTKHAKDAFEISKKKASKEDNKDVTPLPSPNEDQKNDDTIPNEEEK